MILNLKCARAIKTMLTPLDDESKTKHDVAFLIGYGDKDIYARKDDAIKTIDLTQGKTFLLYEHKTSLTDVVDFRICFPNEKSNLKLYARARFPVFALITVKIVPCVLD